MKQLVLILSVYIASTVSVATATIRHVPSEYPTIQAGIDAADPGDTVLVADGTYTGNENRDIDFGGKPILVTSENGPEVTIIDCEGDSLDPHRGFYFRNGEDTTSVLKGFTITNGWYNDGGGIYFNYSSPTITGNIISRNTAVTSGGGIYCNHSSPTIKDNAIRGNIAYWYGYGGGIYCNSSSPVIEGNKITSNEALSFGMGGGIFCSGTSSPVIVGNEICGNSAEDFGCCGGIFCGLSSSPTIESNTISGNSTRYNGAGILCNISSAIIKDNRISGNYTLFGDGSGIYCADSSPTIEGNLIIGNIIEGGCGGGICCYGSSPTIVGNTIAGNWKEGIYCGYNSSPTVNNCIIWVDNILLDGTSSIIVTYSDVEGGWEGEGNIDADPLFVDGYHLSQPPCQPDSSPCVDAGDPSSPVTEGTTRTDDACDICPVDMGYHYYPCIEAPWYIVPTYYFITLWAGTTRDTSMTVINLSDSLLTYEAWSDSDWVIVDPAYGELGPGETDTLSITFDANCLAPEDRSSNILVVCQPWSDTATVPCDATVDSSLLTVLTPHQTSVQQGDTLGFTALIENPTDSIITFDAWIDAYFWNGKYYRQNPVLGPVVATISPGGDLEGDYRVRIPKKAGIADNYSLCLRVGCHSESETDQVRFDEDCFYFDVVAMEP